MSEDKKDNSLVKRKPKIIKMGDDLVKVDDRNRIIGKVSTSDATEFITPSELESLTEKFVTKKDLKDSNFASKEELKQFKPDLSMYMRKDDANAKYVLSKAIGKYATKDEVDEKIKSQSFNGLVKQGDLKDYVKSDSLGKFVTKEELASIISPALLAKLVTKAELAKCATLDDLKSLAERSSVLLKSAESQSLSGDLKISGNLEVNGEKVRLQSDKERRSIRIIKSAPAKLTEDDEYVIIVNNTSDLFGVLLPKGKEGIRYTIKDGTGSAYHSEIKIVSSVGETIDGRESVKLDKAYGVLNLIYNGQEWNII